MENVFPFVENPASEDVVRYSRAGELRAKLNRGEKLTADEKQKKKKKVIDCRMWSGAGIAIVGYIVSFEDVLKRFLYCQYGNWVETYACNKTCLRKSVYGRIDEIVELA